MQVILDSSFARPGSAPIMGGKKGEFRDWTTVTRVGCFVLAGNHPRRPGERTIAPKCLETIM